LSAHRRDTGKKGGKNQMATEITMPKLSDTMTNGQFICWRKNVGDRIERGDIIAEVETDKAVMELEAFASGILIKTMAKEGETVPVGTVLGLIGEPGEMSQTAEAPPPEAEAEPDTAPAMEAAEPVRPVSPTPVTQPAPIHETPEHEKASPMVRRMAREQGIDLGKVQGSGPEGRITQEDLQRFVAGLQIKPQIPAGAPMQLERKEIQTPPRVEETTGTTVAPSAMRRAIANEVTRSWNEIPHFIVTMEIGMDACREIVEELKKSGQHIGYHELTIKACATALEHFPLLLAASDTSDDDIPISFAVSLPDGLMMPVIRECQRLSLLEIAHEASRLADRSRTGKLSATEMTGARFSLSNLGMYGVDEFNALIMPGQRAILAMGAVTERPVVRKGQIVSAPTMRVTLSCDHRVVDGAYAAAFLAELRSILEQPVKLLI
jgi:pyruvate dehydrogenase E2 component (dihydrolipoamide acetyltransferase)